MISVEQTLLDALDRGDPEPLGDWLTTSLARTGMDPDRFDRLRGMARWNSADGVGASLDQTLECVREAVRRSATDPVASALLALYLRQRGEAAWEICWDHEPVRAVITAACTEWRAVTRGVPEAVVEGAWELLRLLDQELLVEGAASSGGLSLLTRLAGLAADGATAIASSVAGTDPIAAHVCEVARRESAFYRAVAGAAGAADRHVSGSADDLDGAIRALSAAEDLHPHEIERSELRAHRASLEALRSARGRPQVHVVRGSVVYLYPFGLRGLTPGKAVDALRRTGTRWTLAGLPVETVARELPLNDIWRGNDPLLRQYAGASLLLPELLLPDPDRDQPHALRVEVRLTRLGNHCIRIETPLEGTGPQGLYAAMLRAAPESADLRELGLPIAPAGAAEGPTWGRLADLATEVGADLCSQFAAHADAPDVQVSARGGTYHVIVRVQEAVARDPGTGAGPLVEDPDALLGLVGGSLLGHPVRHGISSIAEWSRYPASAATRIAAPGLVEGLVLRTANTTTIACPTAPNYMVDTLQEAAEFVATLDGLFAGWQVELADLYHRIKGEMERLSEELANPPAGGWDEGHLDAQQRSLEVAQHEMQLFVMASRLRLKFITAPSLVTSPVMREIIDHLLDAAGFDQARADFVGTVEEVVGDRAWTLIESSVRRRQELADARRVLDEARARRRLDILLAAVTAIGVSGIFSLLQAGYDMRGWLAAALAALALLTAATIAVVTSRVTAPFSRHDRDRSAAGQPPPRAGDRGPR
ncbi:hypothetical protein ACI78V_03980 [Geodermatophilus sp. SYSU D00742]